MAYLSKSGFRDFAERLWNDIVARLTDKVDKVDGKGLSTNDFSTSEKEKLAQISAPVVIDTTIPTTGWAESGEYYTLTMPINGISDVNDPTIYYIGESDDIAETEWNENVRWIHTSNESVEICVRSIPTVGIPIRMRW